MKCGSWLSVVVSFAAAAAAGAEGSGGPNANGSGRQFAYRGAMPEPDHYQRQRRNLTGGPFASNTVARPVSYTYYSTNVHEPSGSHSQYYRPTVRMERHPMVQTFVDDYRPSGGHGSRYAQERNFPLQMQNLRGEYVRERPYLTQGHPHRFSHDVVNNGESPGTARQVKFPLSTVLPGNAINFDHEPNQGLHRGVSIFTDFAPSRNPHDGRSFVRNTVSGHEKGNEMTMPHREGKHGYGGYGGDARNYPYRDYTEKISESDGDDGDVMEQPQRMRMDEDKEDEDPVDSLASYYRSGNFKHGGGGGGGSRHESGKGQSKEDETTSWKGMKGKKGHKKGNDHHKGEKGHHDKEHDSGEFVENLNKEKKYHKDEGFYGEHHNSQKGGKGKKYGEGGKHKKGHTTHGEHNIVKKDEFIKNTKFYDEDHGGGEHEEHGEFYGLHEEKKGGNEEGNQAESDYSKLNKEKKGRHDKGHVDAEHHGHESAGANEHHFQHGEEYSGKKSGHLEHNWAHSSGKH